MKDIKTEKDLSILDAQDINEQAEDMAASQEDNNQTPEKKEKKKIKPWILITSVVLILAIVAVGVFTWYNVTTLATYDGGRITKAEYDKALETTMMAQGITEDVMNDPANAEAVQGFKDELMVSIAYDEVFYKQLENLNIGQLTEEDITAIEEDTQALIDNYTEANLETIKLGLPEGYTESDLEKAIADFEEEALNQIGCYTFEDFVELRIKDEIFNKAYAELLPDEKVAPTNEEVKEEYDMHLQAQIDAFEGDPATYLLSEGTIDLPLYTPSGIRMVRHVLFTISEDTTAEIAALRSEEKDDEADELYTEAMLAVKDDAQAVLDMLDNGEIGFTSAILQYGQDPGMEYYIDGYEVCEGYTGYVNEFTEGAMSLKNIGDYTDLVSSDFGYHIIEYFSDVDSKTVPFEDVSEQLYTTLMEAKRSELWLEYLNAWPIELNLNFKDDALNEINLYEK